MTTGTGAWFAVLCVGLMASRVIGARSLRKGKIVENVSHGLLISVCGYLLFALLENPIGYYGAAVIIGLGNGHVWPGMQTMFINLASSNQRGTANSTQLTCWDLGLGLGVVLGGLAIEHVGYASAFWMAFIVNAVGVCFYFIYVKRHSRSSTCTWPCSTAREASVSVSVSNTWPLFSLVTLCRPNAPVASSWRMMALSCASEYCAPTPKVEMLSCPYWRTLSESLPRSTSRMWPAPKVRALFWCTR